ncbi:MAG: M20 family metallopeptidase [Spirochaetales bacterium]|nr:M20 family metallopeptidase [Spirochaetales bacterium]
MDVVKELKRLIKIKSVTGSEGEIGKYLFQRFKKLGCKTELFEVDKSRFNILAVIPGNVNDKLGLLFHAHIDTVPPYKMKSPFEPIIKDNHIWGRGSVDQKGGIASVITAFENILSEHETLTSGVGFVGVIDEESEHRGSMFLKDMDIHADYAVVTEPSGLKLGTGCKGTMPIKIMVKGKASHGCRPWLGVSAVEYCIKAAGEITSMDFPVHEIKGIGKTRATINLGIIKGGVAYNIVPDECILWFDRRLIPGETQEEIMRDIHEIIEKYNHIPDVYVTAEIARPDWNWEPIKKRGLKPALTDMESEIVTAVKNAHRSVLKNETKVYFTDGYNEMDFLINDLGIPAVQYGPGDAGLCHTNDEMMDITQLKNAANVYTETIKTLCR